MAGTVNRSSLRHQLRYAIAIRTGSRGMHGGSDEIPGCGFDTPVTSRTTAR